jgi:hypothetical protein
MSDDASGGAPAGPRLAFDQETFLRAQGFAHELLADIPELEGVAIIPSWTIPQSNVPYGIVVGRNGPLRTPAEIQHMAVQVHGCLRQQLENAFAVIRMLDAEMGRLAGALRERASTPDTPPQPGGP